MTELDRVTPDHALRLDDLVRELGPSASLVGDPTVVVRGIHHDSRRVLPGDLFVARQGAHTDGMKHVADALARGAVSVLRAQGTATVGAHVPVIVVDDVMAGLARASAAIYGHPSFALEVVGVTGTNGKTTTTYLVRAAIDAALGHKSCGIIGTVAHEYGALHLAAAHTTPEADDLQRLLLAMKREGASQVAMEVSSIALALGRTRAVRFTVAAFTNLTQDHLDFHGTMAAYGDAKAKLFLEYGPGTSVVCIDQPFGQALYSRISGPKLRVSADIFADADVKPTRLELSAHGMSGELQTPDGTFPLRTPLVGAHNVENIVVAMGCVCALGLDVARALEAMTDCVGAPGRLERVSDDARDDITVLVDYAHTPAALERVLDALRDATEGRIVCVFGCGGDRDADKRGPMGEAVAKRADVAIITSDNPRTEEPERIAAPIVDAVRTSMRALEPKDVGQASGYWVELDRAAAIEIAVTHAAASDVVLIAGKGHEDYQVVGTEKRRFDDREHAREALARRRARAV
jgi:UDP-N-acetylmuramoyl-L-alanyl-D-glutamate--2,6-diaminopimelate ligase